MLTWWWRCTTWNARVRGTRMSDLHSISDISVWTKAMERHLRLLVSVFTFIGHSVDMVGYGTGNVPAVWWSAFLRRTTETDGLRDLETKMLDVRVWTQVSPWGTRPPSCLCWIYFCFPDGERMKNKDFNHIHGLEKRAKCFSVGVLLKWLLLEADSIDSTEKPLKLVFVWTELKSSLTSLSSVYTSNHSISLMVLWSCTLNS